ncbi:hypothetical protein HJ252_005167 [Escherichia coli]|nr:hypothetical protein [Escherichia coli]
MLARSGKVSMATKKRSGEEINDRQILCGMGIKLRRLTAGICLITQLAFPMAAAAQGVHMNRPGFPGECFICELRLPDHRF